MFVQMKPFRLHHELLFTLAVKCLYRIPLNAANNLKLVLAKNCVLIDAIAILSAGNVTSPSVLQQKQ